MIYSIQKLLRWLTEFGVHGLWIMLRANKQNPAELVRLHSRHYGDILCRGLREDLEAVNTVICFQAYAIDRKTWHGGAVLDLGGNIGVATRYFLAVLPGIPILAIEPSQANCDMFVRNMCETSERERVRLIQCAVGPRTGTGRLIRNATGRLDSLRVEFSNAANLGSSTAISIVALEDLTRELPKPLLLKMDIEGAEDEVLQHRGRWVEPVARMMIEFHDPAVERHWLDILHREGWALHKVFDTWHFTNKHWTPNC